MKNKIIYILFLILPFVCNAQTELVGRILSADSISAKHFVIYEMGIGCDKQKVLAYKIDSLSPLEVGYKYELLVQKDYVIELDDGHWFSLARTFIMHNKITKKEVIFEHGRPLYRLISIKRRL